MSGNSKKAYSLALTTVLFWATVATAFKIGLRNYTPAMLLFFASATSVIVLFIILLLKKKLGKIKEVSIRNWIISSAIGLLNPFAYYLVLFKAYSLLPAQLAQPINMVWPIVLVLLSVPILKQKVSWRSMVSLLISFTGVFIISTRGNLSNLGDINLSGICLALTSSLLWSLYWIFNQKSTVDGEVGLFINFLAGTVYLSLFLLFTKGFLPFGGESFWAAIYIGIFEAGVSFVLWMKALSLAHNKAAIANVVYIVPFFSLIFIHFIIGETIFFSTLVGLFFIISGILFQQTETRHQKKARRI
jgi:drug/metabolite transporter (DMT)-like permease